MKVIFFGMNTKSSYKTLEKLIDVSCVEAVFVSRKVSTKKSKPSSRYRQINNSFYRFLNSKIDKFSSQNNDICGLARQNGIPVFKYHKMLEKNVIDQLSSLESKNAIISNFPGLISGTILDKSGKTFVNLHPSLLPNYRGPNPYFWIYYNFEKETGVTLHYVDSGEDSGNIVNLKLKFRASSHKKIEEEIIEKGNLLLTKYLDQVSKKKEIHSYKQKKFKAGFRAKRVNLNLFDIDFTKIRTRQTFHFLKMSMFPLSFLRNFNSHSVWILQSFQLTEKCKQNDHTRSNRLGVKEVHCKDGYLIFKSQLVITFLLKKLEKNVKKYFS